MQLLLVVSFLVSNSRGSYPWHCIPPVFLAGRALALALAVVFRCEADGGGLYKYICSIELDDHGRSGSGSTREAGRQAGTKLTVPVGAQITRPMAAQAASSNAPLPV